MDVIQKKVSEIKPYEKNPRMNDSAVKEVRKSIEQFGWQQPIVVDSDGVIIVGHTRFKAAQEMGLETVPVVVASNLTPVQAKAYRIADNKTSDFSIFDNKLLLEELESIDLEGGADLYTGFEESLFTDGILDERDNEVLLNNEDGIIYEAVFKSDDKKKIDKIIELWNGLPSAVVEEADNEK